MNSQIKVITPNLRISVIFGLTLAAIAVFAIIRLDWYIGIGLILLSGAVAFRIVLLGIKQVNELRHNNALLALNQRKMLAEVQMLEHQAERSRLEAYIITVPKTQRVITLPDSPIRLIEAVVEPQSGGEPPADPVERAFDLITTFTQPDSTYAIIGGARVGKTYHTQKIANYWAGKGIKPMMIGPKWRPGEWVACERHGGQGDYDRVMHGLDLLAQEARRRHTQNEIDHPTLPVFVDDWTPIVNRVEKVEDLMLDASTLYASVNILLYFIIHSDTVDAWGVKSKGAALKDNFVKLILEPVRDRQGAYLRDQTRGYVVFPGEKEQHPVNLSVATPMIVPTDQPALVSYEIVPNEQEQAILDMHEAGTSMRKIAQQVYEVKQPGVYHFDKIKAVLSKYNVEIA